LLCCRRIINNNWGPSAKWKNGSKDEPNWAPGERGEGGKLRYKKEGAFLRISTVLYCIMGKQKERRRGKNRAMGLTLAQGNVGILKYRKIRSSGLG